MPTRLLPIITRFQSAGVRILHIFTNVTGLTPETALLVLWIILGYIIFLLIFIPLHKSLLRVLKKKKEKLTREYDTLRYLVAKAQKQNTMTTEFRGIKVLFDTTHPDYFHHHAEIKSEIKSIESGLGATIVDDVTRVKIEKKLKNYDSLKLFVNIFGRIISAITILVYKLFW
ncbi:MAG: hypothetical protein NTX91_00715 [candidate division SR1 bacterium]|nr:hypothetical protein [candidate division SR1 bacterium]